jgi:sugar transferase (PEP-CTERM system associated)
MCFLKLELNLLLAHSCSFVGIPEKGCQRRMIKIFNHYISKATLALLCLDLFVILFSFFVAVATRFSTFSIPYTKDPTWPKAANFVLLMLLTLGVVGLYQPDPREGLRGVLLRLSAGFLLALGMLSLAFYLLPSLYLGRGVFAFAFVSSLFGILLVRMLFFRWTSLGVFKPRILVVGTGTRAIALDSIAQESPARSYFQVVGFFPVSTTEPRTPPLRIVPRDGSLMSVVNKYQIDEIVIAVRDRRGGGLPIHELLECRLNGVRVTELSSFFERECGQVRLDSLNTSWMVFGEGFKQSPVRETVKRVFDIVVSLALMLVTSPVTLLVAVCIFLESGLPVFYRQQRVGQGGRVFTILKFRSMRNDAEVDGKPRWASAQDDRTTTVGRLIRKLRIDELPQIFNVLKGEMSFVGPRPERPYFVQQLTAQIPYYAVRHSVKPGISGWAQVRYEYGASLEDAVEKLQYDLYYVKNHSLFLDIMILIDTIRVVLLGKGAR